MGMDAVFKALADPVRRGLLDALHEQGGRTLAELCEGREMSRQAVSKHLAVLEGANLVAVRRRGREKLHFLNPVPIQEIADRWIGKYERAPAAALIQLKRRLEDPDDG
jgi:DNA-binding transcriptional ArsR family regulator